jgi:pimeloyl-ACP methyl ester carboxylesterase
MQVSPTEKMLDFEKANIFYRVIGKGPAVFLIHGVPLDGDVWNDVINTLTGFKFIVPDLPGSGRSELIEDTSMEGMAEVIKAVLDKEKISSACFIGHSMGGYISLAFAEKYSNYLSGLGLFHSTSYPDSDERKAARRKAIESINAKGAPEFLKTSIPNLFSPEHKERNKRQIDTLIEKTNNFSSKSLVSYYQAMMKRPARRSILKDIQIPLLIIAGKYDTVVPLNDSLEQSHLPEKSYFHILTESGHMGMLEEANKVNIILKNYLDNFS